MNLINKVLLSLLFFNLTIDLYSQTTGMIVEPATGASVAVLDPNGDGYTSSTPAGFLGNDKTNSEIAFKTLIPAGTEPDSDIRNGPDCGFSDFVESTAGGIDPAFHFSNASYWFFRFRMAGIAPNAKSYSILIDIDGQFGPTAPNYTANNPGFDIEIVLATKFSVDIYDHRLGGSCTPVKSYTSDRIQKSICASSVCVPMNYFLDFYVDWADLTATFGITPATSMRYAIVDNMAAKKSTICNPSSASDIGGVNDKTCGSLENCFTNVILNQPACSPNSASTCVYSDCPVITGLPLQIGATSVSGTSTEANGSTIRVYVNGVLVGSTTTITAGNWTVSPITALAANDNVKATAQAIGEVESGTNCNNVQIAGATCTPPITSAAHCGKSIQGLATPGALIRVYQGNNSTPDIPGGGTIWTSGQSITATTLPSALSPTTDNFLHKCTADGVSTGCNSAGPACLVNGAYRITQQMTGQCESTPVWICVGGLTQTLAPTITTTITTATTTVTGEISGTLDDVVNVLVVLYVNGFQKGTANTTATGSWTINSLTFNACDNVHAIAIRSGKCPSPNSATQVVAGGTTAVPVVNGPFCGTTTTVSGTSTESDGTTIEVFDNGVSVGTTTVTGGVWTKTGLSIASGRTITAKATNTSKCKSQSAASAGIVVGTKNANAVAITPNPVIENAVSINGTGVNGDLVTLYIDNWPLYLDFAETTPATATVAGGLWSMTLINPGIFYVGGVLTVKASNGSTCQSSAQDPTPIVCLPPSSSLVVNPDASTVCTGTAVTNVEVVNSQAGVIYQLYNNTLGANSGSSKLGTGSNITLSTAPISAPATISVKGIKAPYDGSCNQTLTETIAVSVITPPTLVLGTTTNPTTCSGTNGTIKITGLANSVTYTVYYTKNGTPTNASFTSNASGEITITGLSAGTYTSIYTNGAGCNSANTLAGPVTLTDPSVPSAPVVGTITQPTCAVNTGSVALSGLPSGAWTINPGTITGSGTTTTVTGLSAATTHNLTVTETSTGCTSSASANIVVNAVPTGPTASVLAGGGTICVGSSCNLSATITGGTSPFSITVDNGVGTINNYNSGDGISVSPITTTTYSLTSVIDANGCSSSGVSGTPIVTVNPMPTATIVATSPICVGANSTLTINLTGTANWTVKYSDGTTTFTESGISSSPFNKNVTPSVNTTYTLTEVSDVNCTNTTP